MTSSQERRKHQRKAVGDLPIIVNGDIPLRVRDLSQSGACFFSETPLRMMTHVKFSFEFKNSDDEPVILSGEGVVVRCERIAPSLGHYEVAIFFQSLDEGGSKAITQYLVDKQEI
ncbi:MAG: hypothetical protein ACI84O_001303 [Myxococcota bacterium]|jgi:hypothetical protein